jgi:hypothetical protein
MIKVHYWPSGCWCWPEDLDEYLMFCSDDFTTLELDETSGPEDIDELILGVVAEM